MISWFLRWLYRDWTETLHCAGSFPILLSTADTNSVCWVYKQRAVIATRLCGPGPPRPACCTENKESHRFTGQQQDNTMIPFSNNGWQHCAESYQCSFGTSEQRKEQKVGGGVNKLGWPVLDAHSEYRLLHHGSTYMTGYIHPELWPCLH